MLGVWPLPSWLSKQRVVTLKEIKEINQIALETTEEKEQEEEEETVLTFDVGELLVLQEFSMPKKPHGKRTKEHISFILSAPSKGRYVG